MPFDFDALQRAYRLALERLLAERTSGGYWVGELSSSALSTAVAVSALAQVQRQTARYGSFQTLIDGGLRWLIDQQNADGGWGDTVKSLSNISTTMLVRAAFRMTDAVRETTNAPSPPTPLPRNGGEGRRVRPPTPLPRNGGEGRKKMALQRADAWMTERYGSTPQEHAEAVRARYGKDRTFSVPILMTSALAGLVAWDEVPRLPFELACLPQSWFHFLRLPVVSYALPALIAIGQAIHHHRPSWNPLRRMAIPRSLRVLEHIQPSNGGFLEAAPLTAFVTLSLASKGLAEHEVVRKGVGFLTASVRPDGSWPIDTNLSTWVTTLAVNALHGAGALDALEGKAELLDWLLDQQYAERHPFTGAAPGGWGWTPLPGGVPDADDTAGAVVALKCLKDRLSDRLEATYRGLDWLADLQNGDGGVPTFCRGWGHLPFDRSSPDITAHALRAFGPAFRATPRALAYLARVQRPDGSWLPLWFGNQHAADDINPTYGTARVLAAYRDLKLTQSEPWRRGVAWLLKAQNADGGWGGAAGVPSSLEETALAVEVLLDTEVEAAEGGLAWLVERVEAGALDAPTPIGFYFARLWYFEKLYPVIFAVAALGRAVRSRLPAIAAEQEGGHARPAGR